MAQERVDEMYVKKLLRLKETNPEEYQKGVDKLREKAQGIKNFGVLDGIPGFDVSNKARMLKALGELRQEDIPLSFMNNFVQESSKLKPDIGPDGKPIQGYSEGGSIFKRVKGTVGGTGSGNKDTVKALLAPGEEVVRSSSANLFRPLLKDINDNAGRMWNSFTTAIRKQDENNILQEEVNKKFEDTLKVFNKEITKILNERRNKKLKELANISGGSGKGGASMRVAPASAIKTKTKTPSKSIQTYRRGRGGSASSRTGGESGGTGNVTVLNNTQPALTLANENPEPIETESTERSQTSITISSTDESNPYIMNSYVNYGIDV